ncbi:MAG: hypothetical protein D6790_13200 [Caldilineae bacterium]|nr:MAG: hypothetical protein D6790_13200 [Caldilineae bacterium]
MVQIYLYNYPGWQVTLDGQPVEVRPSPPSGLMEIDAPVGRHTIDIRMGSTPVRTGGMLISGGALLALLGLWLWGRARRQ